MVGRDDLSGHAAAPLGAAGLIRERLTDQREISALGPGLLDGSAR